MKMARSLISSVVNCDIAKYQEAVKTLNTLQTNAQTLEKIRQQRDKHANLNIPKILSFAARLGIQEGDMERLNVIHVSGTKGKGSTCAYSESILRHHGYKTGFFSSPHLVEVRERIWIDGSPLERDKFASYFWNVYSKLDKTKADHDGMMPNYFGFLTVMALHVFLEEKVDVAIMEVGIGGQYDSTNVFRKPVVCGVTSLGLDHTSILGTTIDKIAWHKAGIFKAGVPAFTIPQLPDAMLVLKKRAAEIGAMLFVCPDLSEFGRHFKLGIKGSVQNMNASLALQLCKMWIDKQKMKDIGANSDDSSSSNKSIVQHICDIPLASAFSVGPQYLQGLEQCQWLGRNQTIKQEGITFYLDGAHTLESIQQCVEWFLIESKEEELALSKTGMYKVLIFNTTGDRDVGTLITPLLVCPFDAVLFCPNIAYDRTMNVDQTKVAVTIESQLSRCIANMETFKQLKKQEHDTYAAEISCITGKYSCDQLGRNVYFGETHCSQASVDGIHSEPEHPNFNVNNQNSSCVDNGCRNTHLQLHTLPSIWHCINWICTHGGTSNTRMSSEVSPRVNGCESKIKTLFAADDSGNKCMSENNADANVNRIYDCESGDFINISHKNQIKNVAHEKHIQVLVTGSLHLVGGALKVIWDDQ